MPCEDTELVRALKEMIELRSSKSASSPPLSPPREEEEAMVTLFGKRISKSGAAAAPRKERSSIPDSVLQSIERLTAAKASSLKDLYKQHLKKRGRSTPAAVGGANEDGSSADCLTLPLLSSLQDLDGPDMKRQRTGNEEEQLAAASARRGPIEMTGDKRLEAPVQCSIKPAAQLTIFYKGAVHVFDGVPTDQAQAMMILAESSSSKSRMVPLPKPFPSVILDLPQARKASLQRFLVKRKDRLSLQCATPGASSVAAESPLKDQSSSSSGGGGQLDTAVVA